MTTKTSSRSRYDELHDKYHTIRTTKAGTRYERLAALVFKALEDKNVVIHDMELAGEDPDVKHQIDVTVEVAGAKRRVIIECKDFDISGGKVGLDIIRNFRSVIEDTKADEGIVITCNDFTQDARRYARSKGIKLAVLPAVRDARHGWPYRKNHCWRHHSTAGQSARHRRGAGDRASPLCGRT